MQERTAEYFNEFLSDILNSPEVQLLADYIREIAKPPYLKDGEITLVTNAEDRVSLSITNFVDKGIRLTLGFYDGHNDMFSKVGSIWAGKMGNNSYGQKRGRMEKDHDITWDISNDCLLTSKAHIDISDLIYEFRKKAEKEFLE
jgi:hypothetical protein